MSASFNVDIEAGLVSERRIRGATLDDGVYGGTVTECQSDSLPGKSKSGVGATTASGPFPNDTPRKAYDFYLTQFCEQRATVILESWDGSAESILLFAGVFSMVVSLFIIEGYQRLSPDAADQAVALFDQLSRLVGISAGIPLELSQPLALDAAASFKPSPSAVRATTLWFLSLGMNVTCFLWVLWQQWWLQSIDPRGESHAHARLLAYPFSRMEHFGLGDMVEVIWMLLQSSALLFFVGLVDFVHPINTTITWILLGYLALLASFHAVKTLLPYRFLIPHHPPLPPDSA